MPTPADTLRLIRACRRPPALAGWARYLDGMTFDGAARHPGTAELVYLEQGRMRWRTADGDRDIRAPALVLARPGEDERRRFSGTCRHAFVHLTPDRRSLGWWRSLPAPVPLAITGDSLVPVLVRQVVDLVQDRRTESAGVVLAASHLLLAIALAGDPGRAPRALDDLSGPVRRALIWLQEDWRSHGVRRCGLDDLAAAAGCSPRHCGRLFQADLDLQPVQAVQVLRAGLAQIQLERTDRSVAEIAARLGFRHANHLGQLLTATFGMGPAAMRRARAAGSPVPRITHPALREVLNVLDA